MAAGIEHCQCGLTPGGTELVSADALDRHVTDLLLTQVTGPSVVANLHVEGNKMNLPQVVWTSAV